MDDDPAKFGIEVRGLIRSYAGVPVVSGVSLAVERGTIYGFLGPNGAGKSTTLRMLLGLVRPSAGSVAILGRERTWGDRPDPRVGAMLERPGVYPQLSARQNLAALATVRGLRASWAVLDRGLADVGLDPRDGKPAGKLSSGNRQRLAIALAMLGQPSVLILDEPTDGLDPGGIVELRRLVAEAAARGCAVLMSSHLISEVERVCTKVGILVRGRLVAELGHDRLRHGTPGTRLTFLDAVATDSAARILEDAGIRCVTRDGLSLTVGADLDGVADPVTLLAQGDVLVGTSEQATISLEDLFLSLIGRVAET